MYFILGKPTVWPFLNAVIFRASTHLMNPSDPDTCRILQSRKEASERDFLAKKKKGNNTIFFFKKSFMKIQNISRCQFLKIIFFLTQKKLFPEVGLSKWTNFDNNSSFRMQILAGLSIWKKAEEEIPLSLSALVLRTY